MGLTISLAAVLGLKSRFLQGLEKPELESILPTASQRRLLANSVVQNQGEPASRLFLLTSGRARYFYITEDGRKILFLWLRPGDIFGGGALLAQPLSYLVNVETVKDSQMLVWDRTTIRSLAARYPRLRENALSIAWDYFTYYVATHTALVSNTARERLARVLVNLANGIGHEAPGGIQLEVTNEDLANEANVTVFTASRLLSEWQRNGAILKSRGKILLRLPERLSLHAA
ncbi:MAG TPA: Crp/Fnr family transcriptional regulator [Terriglobales bacterium]|jgi:CRP-like cAMP-binding protein|nr:Crp/Fnr family transcriptional regulator [Terriglobales bacterium]